MKQSKVPRKNTKYRIFELDFIRGTCIFFMILDHTLYDLAFIFIDQWAPSGFLYQLCNFARHTYFPWVLRDVIREIIIFLFIFICGTSCSFSRSNFKRGVRLLAVALALSAFTCGADQVYGHGENFIIRFGILHMLAVSILLYCLLKRLGFRVMLILAIASLVLGLYFSHRPLDTDFAYMNILMYTDYPFYSADYFPLMPFSGYFLIGTTVGQRLYRERRSLLSNVNWPGFTKPVLFAGRNALFIYILHQPLIYSILFILGFIVQKGGFA
jgi:uncharacterized membrane protein